MKIDSAVKAVAVGAVALFGITLCSGEALGINERLNPAVSAKLAIEKIDGIKHEVKLLKEILGEHETAADAPATPRLDKVMHTYQALVLKNKILDMSSNVECIECNNNLEHLDGAYKATYKKDAPRDSRGESEELRKIAASHDEEVIRYRQQDYDGAMQRLMREDDGSNNVVINSIWHGDTIGAVSMKARWKAHELEEAATRAGGGSSETWLEVAQAWEALANADASQPHLVPASRRKAQDAREQANEMRKLEDLRAEKIKDEATRSDKKEQKKSWFQSLFQK